MLALVLRVSTESHRRYPARSRLFIHQRSPDRAGTARSLPQKALQAGMCTNRPSTVAPGYDRRRR